MWLVDTIFFLLSSFLFSSFFLFFLQCFFNLYLSLPFRFRLAADFNARRTCFCAMCFFMEKDTVFLKALEHFFIFKFFFRKSFDRIVSHYLISTINSDRKSDLVRIFSILEGKRFYIYVSKQKYDQKCSFTFHIVIRHHNF